MKPTIRDVARAAGVAKSTVSVVLNESRPQVDRIPMATRARIKACAADLGYRGSRIATALSTGKSPWVGVISDVLPDDPAMWTWAPFFEMSLLSGVQRELAMRGYFALLGLRQAADEVADVDRLASADIGGLILRAARERAVERAQQLIARGIPVVNVFPIRRSDLAPYIVDLDNVAAGQLAAEILLTCGCKKLACITRDGHITQDRARGLAATIRKKLGRSPARCTLQWGADDTLSVKLIADFLREKRPDAVAAMDGGLARLLAIATELLSVNVPGEMSIVGFDCLALRTPKYLRFSSVGVSWLQAGEVAARIIVDTIEGVGVGKLPKLLPPVFVPGDTTPPGLAPRSADELMRALAQSAT